MWKCALPWLASKMKYCLLFSGPCFFLSGSRYQILIIFSCTHRSCCVTCLVNGSWECQHSCLLADVLCWHLNTFWGGILLLSMALVPWKWHLDCVWKNNCLGVHSVIFLAVMETKFYWKNISTIVIFEKKKFQIMCHMITPLLSLAGQGGGLRPMQKV